jgi:hypothetical protein
VKDALTRIRAARVLPFRFVAAARYAPQWEAELESAMLKSLAEAPKLPGKTVLLVDVSGSMLSPLSKRSEMLRTDAAYGLAVLLRELAEEVEIYTFSNELKRVPARRGFALRDALDASQPHQGTYLGKALRALPGEHERVIVLTDEQAHDAIPDAPGRGYVINVASYKNGVGYGRWMHIDGWSEAVLDYIRALESAAL